MSLAFATPGRKGTLEETAAAASGSVSPGDTINSAPASKAFSKTAGLVTVPAPTTAPGTGGLRALEVTLRTPEALEAMKEMKAVPGAVVGAGTVTSPAVLEKALDAGAEFIVSPGLTEPHYQHRQ